MRPDTIAQSAGEEFFSVQFRGQPVYGLRPFGRKTVAAAYGQKIAFNGGEGCHLDIVAASGVLAERFLPPCNRAEVTEAAIRLEKAARLAAFTRSGAREFAAELNEMRPLPYPERTPPYSRVLFDGQDRLWVQMYPLPTDAAQQWWILGDAGRRV